MDYYEANVRLQLGERDDAVNLLARYLDARPAQRDYIAREWWWETLRDHPRFQALLEK
ncbi:MAG: hypothetical protein GWN58_51225 [Anaerolineae bacterium]|nr:hypothetical protein [Anaerolineae bacterium]